MASAALFAPSPIHTNAMRVGRHVTRPGHVVLAAVPDHRVKVHTGKAVTGSCGSSRFRYGHGDVDLLPAGSSDHWEEDTGSTSVMLQFPPSLLVRAADELGLDGSRVGLIPRHQFRDAQIGHIAWALDADREAGNPGGKLYVESLTTALATYLVSHHRAPLPPLRGLSKPQLRRVTDYIEAGLDQDLSLARIAGVAGIGTSHLKTLFKRSMGLPVHAYVVQRRVERARTLLLQRDMPASQVALEAGFSHQSHMMRCMRRVLGSDASMLLRRGRA